MTDLPTPVFGVNTFVWTSPLTTPQLSDLAEKIAGWGFGAIELPLEQVGDWDAESTAEILRRHDLRPVLCAVMPPGRDLVASSPDVVSATQAYLRKCVDVAQQIGAAHVVGPIYAAVGRTWRATADERVAMLREGRERLRPIADYAGERGVRLGVEPLNRYETSVLNTTEQALDFIDGLPAETVGLNLDLYHMNIEETDIPAALRAAGPALSHLQVSGNDRGTPGRDHLDWPGVRSALVEIGYDGVIGIESFTADNKTIATAASVWRPLAASQNALAIDGLAFLRDWWGAEA
ncbi:sugar phosphate isomerase/epimerase family protein [Streptomyces griseoluteus]|uniref:sugar phosphate isomerase/epimerase family protein n=1 Tax=Streptomyces griseoluteus TaxID=29306 RepID=UPI0036C94B37